MYGLHLQSSSPAAVFRNTPEGHQATDAARSLLFLTKGARVVRSSAAIKGVKDHTDPATLKLIGTDGEHVITVADRQRYGL